MKERDILDEVQMIIKEERRQKIGNYLLLSIFVVGFFAVVVMIFTKWYQDNQMDKLLSEETQLYKLIAEIENPNMYVINGDEQVAKGDQKAYIMERIKKMETLFRENTSFYSAYAGFYLSNIEIAQGNITKGLYYLKEIADNTDFDPNIRDNAVLDIINIKLRYESGVSSDELEDILKNYIKERNTLISTVLNQTNKSGNMQKDGYNSSLLSNKFDFVEAVLFMAQSKFNDAKEIFKEDINEIAKQEEKDVQNSSNKKVDVAVLMDFNNAPFKYIAVRILQYIDTISAKNNETEREEKKA